jgi:hypothetical protein
MNKNKAAITPPSAAPASGVIAAPIKPTVHTTSGPKPAPEPNATDAFGCLETTPPGPSTGTPDEPRGSLMMPTLPRRAADTGSIDNRKTSQ